MNGFSERSRKAWETRKRMESSRGYGPKGRKRGTEAHKVKSVSEILARLRSGTALASPETYIDTNHGSGDPTPPTPLDCRTHDAGVLRQAQDERCSADARKPETTG